MTQLEFYKSFLFVIELLIAEGMYLHSFRRRSHFPIRLVIGIAACFLFAWLFPILIEDAFYCSFMFLMIFLFTALVCKLLFQMKWQMVLFCCFAGYTTQHLSYEIYNLTLSLMHADISTGFYGAGDFTNIFPNLFVFAVYLSVYVFSYSICYGLFGRNLEVHESIDIKGMFIFIFAVVILIVDIILNSIVVYSPIKGAETYEHIIAVYNILCCGIALYLQFQVAMRSKIQTDFEFMQQMWNKAKEQYAISKENIELINLKCHDFKHQIRKIRNSETITPVALRELEDYINIYDSVAKTGNEALDVILTEKSLLCNKNNIIFTYIADGDKLDFMREEDIYNLFGNIIDNAIEAMIKVEESKRVINMHVQMVNDMLVIREHNYCEGTVDFENGLPRTTKSDHRFHGVGTKSIRYICERYGGNCTFTVADGVFEVNIVMFPPR